jgi:hypothetical protein
MRTVALALAFLTAASGCAETYVVTKDSLVEVIRTHSAASRDEAWIPARAEATGLPVQIRFDALALDPDTLAALGARTFDELRIPASDVSPLQVGGGITFGIGAVLGALTFAAVHDGLAGRDAAGPALCFLTAGVHLITGTVLLIVGSNRRLIRPAGASSLRPGAHGLALSF